MTRRPEHEVYDEAAKSFEDKRAEDCADHGFQKYDDRERRRPPARRDEEREE